METIKNRQRRLQYEFCSLNFASQLRIALVMDLITDDMRQISGVQFTQELLNRVWQRAEYDAFDRYIHDQRFSW